MQRSWKEIHKAYQFKKDGHAQKWWQVKPIDHNPYDGPVTADDLPGQWTWADIREYHERVDCTTGRVRQKAMAE